jgi:hypothetical protein
MNDARRTFSFIVAALLISIVSLTAYAQSGMSSVQGTVTDSIGAVIPGANIILTNTSTGVALTAQTDSTGNYIPTRFDLGSLRAAGPAPMKQIYAASRYERNDEIEPRHVLPLDGIAKISNDGVVSIVLPHESVTVIRVPVK